MEDTSTPVEGARALHDMLISGGHAAVELLVFEGLDATLGGDDQTRLWSPEVEDAAFAWLDGVLAANGN
jgi:hypothetical protein